MRYQTISLAPPTRPGYEANYHAYVLQFQLPYLLFLVATLQTQVGYFNEGGVPWLHTSWKSETVIIRVLMYTVEDILPKET